jgi:hypothetical protein
MLNELKGESFYTADQPAADESWTKWVHKRLPALYKMIPKVGGKIPAPVPTLSPASKGRAYLEGGYVISWHQGIAQMSFRHAPQK